MSRRGFRWAPRPRAATFSVLVFASGLLMPFDTGWREADPEVRGGSNAFEDRAWLTRSHGAYEEAADLYLQMFRQSQAGHRAQTGQSAAEALLAAGNFVGAVDLARAVVAESPSGGDLRLIEAQGLLALGRLAEAERATLAHQQAAPLAGYGAFLGGGIATARRDAAGARDWYRWAIDFGVAPLWEVAALHAIAEGFADEGDMGAAGVAFERAAWRAIEVEDSSLPTWYEGDLVRRSAEARPARLLLASARNYLAAGAMNDAGRLYLQLATTYPGAGESITALDALRDLGRYFEVPPYYRGRILLQSGQLADAVSALARTFEGGATYAQEAAAGYYSALAIRDADEPRRAMDEFAWTAANYAESSWASESLWQRARIAEDSLGSRAGRDAYVQLADVFPGSSRAGQGLSRTASLAVQAGDLTEARELWRRLSSEGPDAGTRSEGLFLLGKSLIQSGNQGGGMTLLEQAEQSAPLSFAGLRARDARRYGLGSEPYRQDRANAIGATSASDAESCASWLATWAGSSASTPDARLARIDRLMAVGMRDAGDAEALEGIAAASPAQLYPLATGFADRRMYPLSMLAATRLAAASPARIVDASPACLQRLAYPLAFPELVAQQAAANGLDPYLFLALLRQESWFSPNARSGAPALGLSQVIPATAADIAKALGRPGFRWEDLARPTEAVTFGSWYLAQQISDLGQRPVLALAAYNAGPGNARRWAGGNLAVDPDDFVFAIDFAETRAYVRSIYEHYAHYRQLYG